MTPILPFDICRCPGVSTDAGELIKPCCDCRRVLHARPQGERTPWMDPPWEKGKCAYWIPVEER